MTELVFFYGTLMAGFDRRQRAGIDDQLSLIGRGSIDAALFDLGLYPAAIPSPESRVWGELYRMTDVPAVLAALDDIEGYRADDPDRSLYIRSEAGVLLPDGSSTRAWVYFYNAPLGQAPRISTGDYLQHIRGVSVRGPVSLHAVGGSADTSREMTDEFRDRERVPLGGQVTGEVMVYQPVTILDISHGGAQIETQFPMQLDSLHDFRLALGPRSIVVKARIAHCHVDQLTESSAIFRSGVEFIEPSDHVREALAAFVAALKAANAAASMVDVGEAGS